jgi:hypothetical protein
MDEPKDNKVKENVHEVMKIREDGVSLVNTFKVADIYLEICLHM